MFALIDPVSFTLIVAAILFGAVTVIVRLARQVTLSRPPQKVDVKRAATPYVIGATGPDTAPPDIVAYYLNLVEQAQMK